MKEKYTEIYQFLEFTSKEIKDIVLGIHDERQLNIISEVINNGRDYKLEELLNKEYISIYGIDLILNNINDLSESILRVGLENERVQEIIKTLDKHNVSFSFVSSWTLEEESITKDYIEETIPLLNNSPYARYFFDCLSDYEEGRDFFKKAVVEDSNERVILDLITKRFDPVIQNRSHGLIEIEDRDSLAKFINIFPNELFNERSSFKRFIKLYNKNENLMRNINIEDLDKEDLRLKFKIYITDQNKDNLNINTKEDLDNIYQIRYNFYKEKIKNCDNLNQIRGYITQNYFGMRYRNFIDKLREINKASSRYNFLSLDENNKLDELHRILTVSSKEELLDIYENINKIEGFNNPEDLYLYFPRINKKLETVYQEDIVDTLTEVDSSKDVIYYTGEDFNFFVHKIIGLGKPGLALELNRHPEKWMESAKKYIDVTYINQDVMGLVAGGGIKLILNKVNPWEVVGMGPEDIMTNQSNVTGDITNLRSKFMFSDELIENTVGTYNNVVLMKTEEEREIPFMPSGILCFDEIDQLSKKASKAFGKPIVVVERKPYINKGMKKIDESIERKDYEEYSRVKKQMFFSILDNRELINKYFSLKQLLRETRKVISQTDPNSSEDLEFLKVVIKTNSQINSLKTYFDISYDDYEYASEKNISKFLKKSL